VLGSPRMRALLEVLRDQQDVVVVDAPPLLPVVDGAVLSSMADTCLLVARYGRTRREHLAEAAATVARVRVPSLGVAINRLPRRSAEATAGSRGYRPDTRRPHAPLAVGAPPASPDHPQASRPGEGPAGPPEKE
jgi:succinoglycan biosynthesis transport protein ExoP